MREVKRNTIKRKHKKWPWILLILIILIASGTGIFWMKYGYDIKSSIADGYSYSEGLTKSDFRPKNSTVIYDRNGKVLKKLSQSSSDYVSINQINPKLKRD
jgi:Membrane carboxypeptidase/penicillin-binding protein